MNKQQAVRPLGAADHARAMAGYIAAGAKRALCLGNRGPIKLDEAGRLDPAILEAYWRHGFYVFECEQFKLLPHEIVRNRHEFPEHLAGRDVQGNMIAVGFGHFF